MKKPLLALSMALLAATAMAEPMDSIVVQHETPIPTEPIATPPDGATEKIFADWSARMPWTGNAGPDHSYNSAWIRMFPILTAALGDPYGPTQDLNDIEVENDQSLEIYTADTKALIGTTTSLHLDFTKSTFLINNVSHPLVPLWIVPHTVSSPTTLHWDQGMRLAGASTEVAVQLRGGFLVEPTDFTSAANGKPLTTQTLWSVINVVNVDDYLQAVVPSEAEYTWDPAALQVQAIAARTYGMFQMVMARTKNRDWDMDPTTWFQSYRGVAFLSRTKGTWIPIEQPTTTAAVAATAGEIVTYNGKVIQAYFSGNSGGVTCTAAECFGEPNVGYLVSKPDATGVQSAEGGTWGPAATLTPQAIHDKLVAIGIAPTSTIKNLVALKKGPSGRTWQLRVQMTSGKIDLTAAQTTKLMSLFGPIRSYLYKLGTVSGGKQSIVGHGYGHGVGMSQWGAQLFAQKGWSASKIIKYYYTNTAIVRVQAGQIP